MLAFPLAESTSSSSSTAAALSTETSHHHPHHPLRSDWGGHSPVVSAMVHGNRMNTCADVRDVLAECIQSESTDSICKTATVYFDACLSYRGDE